MSKIRNLPETMLVSPSDLIYVIDVSEGANAGRKATIATLKTAVIADAAEIPYDNTISGLIATDVKTAIDETYARALDHSLRHSPDADDGLDVGPPVTATADGLNNSGVANSFSRSDHKHNIAVAAPVTQNPDLANSAGTSSSVARSDHIHNIPTDAPTTALSPASTNSEGAGTSFARNDHTHAIATGLAADISTIQPDDAAAAGTSDKFARADHKHAIVAGTPSNTGTANSEGVSTSFARADHVHNTVVAYQEATSTVDVTTTSLTDVLITDMTITPAAGTYLITFSSSTVNSGNGAERNYISLYSGGTQITGTERRIGVAGGAVRTVNTQGIATVNGAQAIEARWRVIAGTGTMYARKLILVRLG